jgi:hypothetical protein
MSTERVQILRSPVLQTVDADVIEGVIRDHLDEYTFITARTGSHIAFNDIDLSQVTKLQLIPNWHLYDIYKGGRIAIRLDGPEGAIIGEAEMFPQQFNMRYRGAFGGLDDKKKMEEVKKLKLPVLDESKFFGPGSDKNEYTLPSIVDIKPVEGRHDLYFTFTNDSAKSDEALFPLVRIVLSNKTAR